ncbi:pentatricopeptide repeat-containing protein At5g15010, mitochondrial-like [Dendrobium catenatum]|uniref:Pentatricopeptide repeat-containing protein n=1 Tax=Dendrobium catenatum TaxID=906689 RepID=A0A2I0VJW9_9ASPA|nr:pentatricopeptide repeat-containing protein At5g15010, mitochondrial-like [Dendrobium catenatum]PKU63663.1 Pentatricopeptide repeat-containing protein [Dendrobium catenatum]
MWRRSFRWAALPHLSSSAHPQSHQTPRLQNLNPTTSISIHFYNPIIPPIKNPIFAIIPKSFSSNPTPDNAFNQDDAETVKEGHLFWHVDTVMDCLRHLGSNSAEAKRRLEQCGVLVSPELVAEVLSRLRNDWSAAFTFFLWAGKQPGYTHSVREYHSMISILGKMRRFDTAWSLVNEMRGATHGGPSLVSSQTLLILIRKYSSIHDVGRAISVFYSFKKFGLEVNIDDFQGLLSALCRYKNVEDAEHLLMCNEGTFPFETKSFNIVLNGWCNILVYVRDAKRFWREYEKRRVEKDVVSYGCLISCYSKASNLNDVTKLFSQMKELGIAPDGKVYNAVVYALAKARSIDKAKDLVKLMGEKGIVPNAVTFNSLIRPLCKFRRIQEARMVFDEMLQKHVTPSIRTFHAFFDVIKTEEEMFELLHQMRQTSCKPTLDTYIMLIRKLCRWRLHDSVFRLWNQISESGLSPDRSAYIVLIHGLFLNGKLEEASKYYEEMKEKGFEPEPKTEEMIEAWLAGKVAAGKLECLASESGRYSKEPLGMKSRNVQNMSSFSKNFLKKPETRSITRERGYSFGS